MCRVRISFINNVILIILDDFQGLGFFCSVLGNSEPNIFSQNGFVQNGDESHGRIRETSPQTNKSKGGQPPKTFKNHPRTR